MTGRPPCCHKLSFWLSTQRVVDTLTESVGKVQIAYLLQNVSYGKVSKTGLEMRPLHQGTFCAHPKTVATCRDILKREAALWTFIHVEGVEPTNNLAERLIRPAVLWRKRSFGTQSQAGSHFTERIMTVVATLKQQHRNVLDYLVEACEATN